MSTIATTADFLRLLREDPEFRAEVRRELLTQELIELPEKFAAFVARTEAFMEQTEAFVARTEAFVARTEAFMARTEAFMEQTQQEFSEVKSRLGNLEDNVGTLQGNFVRLEGTVNTLQGTVGRLDGREYERHVSRTLIGEVSRLFGLRRGRLVHSAALGTTPDFHDQMDALVEADHITDDQWHHLLNTDAVVRASKDGRTVYVVAEISKTVHDDDIDRAEERAAILQQATGSTAYPLVVGNQIPQPQMAQAGRKNVWAVIVHE